MTWIQSGNLHSGRRVEDWFPQVVLWPPHVHTQNKYEREKEGKSQLFWACHRWTLFRIGWQSSTCGSRLLKPSQPTASLKKSSLGSLKFISWMMNTSRWPTCPLCPTHFRLLRDYWSMSFRLSRFDFLMFLSLSLLTPQPQHTQLFSAFRWLQHRKSEVFYFCSRMLFCHKISAAYTHFLVHMAFNSV